jgi:fatty acid desaturase
MGSVFAPNHKGMPVLDENIQMGFLRQQVITSRDVSAHPVTDFIYGGLNYQIEHHLFPNMPRNNLKKAQPLVKEFCHARSIPYHETSVMQSHREILGYMHRMSAPLRKKQA